MCWHRAIVVTMVWSLTNTQSDHICFPHLTSMFSTFVSLPTALVSSQDPHILVTDPREVAEPTCDYFVNLYKCSPPLDKPKLWLTMPLVLQVQERVKKNPFVWPVLATLADFCAMLRRGNPRPSPGPDGWEKWCVKNLSDRALQLVIDLHNYSVLHAQFQGCTSHLLSQKRNSYGPLQLERINCLQFPCQFPYDIAELQALSICSKNGHHS